MGMKTSRVGKAKGAQFGSGNTQHNTYLPPPSQSAPRASDGSQTVTITAGNHSTVNNTQTNTHLKFSIPVIGPLLSAAAVHPVVAGITAVVVVGGASVAGEAAMSQSANSGSLSIVRGFHRQRLGQCADRL
jgi:hypothetical protein